MTAGKETDPGKYPRIRVESGKWNRHVVPLMLILGVAIGGILLFLGRSWGANGAIFATLDDSYIHYCFARNLATGKGYGLNPGQPVAGTTSPLWVFLLAGFHRLGFNLEVIAPVLGGGAFLLILCLLYFVILKHRFSRREATLATLTVAFSGPLLWISLSGMETSLFALGWLPLFLIQFRHGSMATVGKGVLLGILLWIRPETLFLGLFYYVFSVLIPFHQGRINTRSFLVAHLALGVTFGGYFLFHLIISGYPIPHTYYAKIAGHKVFRLQGMGSFLFDVGWMFFEWNPLLFVGLVVAPVVARSVPLWSHLLFWILPIFQSFYFPWNDQGGRYFLPLLPWIPWLALDGLVFLTRWVPRPFWPKGFRSRAGRLTVLFLVVLPYSSYWWVNWSGSYAQSAGNLREMHQTMAQWCQKNLPPEALLGVGDIGLLGYRLPNPLLDLNGLISPEVVAFHKIFPPDWAILKILALKRPRYLIILPEWFPFIENFPGFREIYRIHLEEAANIVLGGSDMVVFEPDYSGGRGSWLQYLKIAEDKWKKGG